MKILNEGTRVRIAFTGTVTKSNSLVLSVKRDDTSTTSYFTDKEESKLSIEVLKPEFKPEAGDIYLVRATGTTTWSPWLAMKQPWSSKVEMVSPAGMFSVENFKEAYLNDDSRFGRFEVSKAEVKPEN